MAHVASRELRNDTRSLLARVEAGETITITVGGRAVALLVPIERRPRFMAREEVVRRIVGNQADAALNRELRRLGPDTTDELQLR